MNYTPPYNIENGSIYEYSAEQHAYIHIFKKTQLTKQEYQNIQKSIAVYNANYDKESA